MPDVINENGLTVKTAAEITQSLQDGLRAIYGNDINLEQNSPDGQMVGILTQEAVDQRELAVRVNAGFDPDQAVGKVLDQRVAMNNIARAGGTYTIQPVDITVDRTVNLAGLDAAFNDPNGAGFTVQDNAGNQFILVDSITITAGTHSLNFRAKQIGQVVAVVDTITNPVTIVLGVTTINNSSTALQVGQNQEKDGQLRTRRQRSVALASAGYLNGLQGKVLDLDGVVDARLYENVTSVVDADGIPAHGVWLIVAGGSNADIAKAIYSSKSYGSNMKGAVSVPIPTASGAVFTARFDRPTAANLHVRFDIQRTIPGFAFDLVSIKAFIAANQDYKISDFAETSSLTAVAVAAIADQGGGGVPVNMEISDDGAAWTDYLEAPTLDSDWTLDASRIGITVL